MKKILKKFLSLIAILSLTISSFNFKSYAYDDITGYAGYQPLYAYLYVMTNSIYTEHIDDGNYFDMDKIKINYLTDTGGIDNMWIKGFNGMVNYIWSQTAEGIAKNNEFQWIQEAFGILTMWQNYMNQDAVNSATYSDFNRYTGYEGSGDGVYKYNQEKCLPIRGKMLAACDLRNHRGFFTLDYEGLFKLNYDQVHSDYEGDEGGNDSYNAYIPRYGKNLFPGEITDEQKRNIIAVWEYKKAMHSQNPNASVVTNEHIYADKHQSFEEKMRYDKDHISVYQAVWGNDFNVNEEDKKRALEIEWAFVTNTGSHTDFFTKKYKNGNAPIDFIDDGNGGYILVTKYYTEEDEKTAVDNGWIEELEKQAEENLDTKEELEDVDHTQAESDYTREYGNQATGKTSSDADANKTFKLPLNLGNASTGNGIDDAIGDAEKLVTATSETKSVFSEGDLADFSNSIYNILLSVGIVIAVVVGMILGVKLMLAPVAEKAEAKKLLIPYGIGCAIIFGAFGIWKLAVIILQNV